MRIGLGLMHSQQAEVARLIGQMREAEELGFATVWLPNIFGVDAMTVCALAGAETSRIEIGTAVVPTFSRHPLHMAQQALTTQAATGGRFTLGLGPSHKIVIEGMLGLSYAKPARHVREYVTVLKDLLEKGKTDFEGETYRVKGSIDVACDTKPPVLIGALGPMMRKIAGSLCDGTITWMTGPRTLGEEVGPGVRAAAEAAGRPAPRIVTGLPICLANDADGARAMAGQAFAMYRQIPSYKAMLDLEGGAGPADIAVVGDEKALEAGIQRFAAAGATDFLAAIFPFGDDARASVLRTRAFLSELSKS
ncbi:MAG: TIGR03564 family F420-dependent LLM class oxidoreductase [Deltaproteobacteria bacterium]|nr:TIGR03564 family F420-dependent LLM class oxidoreductase [Deltaproteobacteria bacterium]MBW2362368.1 TIGR03564 family F420-dependent LLM class oxidoreductase [Deltaproteobacteria bacterium]